MSGQERCQFACIGKHVQKKKILTDSFEGDMIWPNSQYKFFLSNVDICELILNYVFPLRL